ncbi:MAG TPA: hypothetical protein ENH85_02230 [Candidatus Scalindua sp.]|nr:hypothetical protein [Candidatus Scalindua sp.]
MAKRAEVSITGLKKNEVTISIKGTAPLITHKWSEKAKRQMLDKQMKKAKSGKEAKDPEADYLATIYFLEDGKRTGFPAVGFKSAMVRAGKQLGYVMADLKGMFFVKPDEGDLVEIHGKHRLREDMVRIGMGTSDIRFRAEYPTWNADITVLYNSSAISAEELAKLLEVAGFACGIGEWRPEKSASGSYGLFEIAN